jgi:hypothetical protein
MHRFYLRWVSGTRQIPELTRRWQLRKLLQPTAVAQQQPEEKQGLLAFLVSPFHDFKVEVAKTSSGGTSFKS